MSPAASLRLVELDGRASTNGKPGSMLLMRIERWEVRRDGLLSEAALREKVAGLGYSPTTGRMYPAGTVAAAQHERHASVEAVLRGLTKVVIDGESAILAAGDIVFVPRGAVRRIEVVGTSAAECLEAGLQAG